MTELKEFDEWPDSWYFHSNNLLKKSTKPWPNSRKNEQKIKINKNFFPWFRVLRTLGVLKMNT